MSIETLKIRIEAARARLDAMRPLRPDALAELQHLYDIENTYASNAIEGNTLTASETQLVIEKGITIGGKTMREHNEAIDHFEALAFVRSLAAQDRPISENDVRDLHALVVKRSNPAIAGMYADRGRFVLNPGGDRHAFPNPAKVPALMGDFGQWLKDAPADPQTAFDAHRQLVSIHPFNDGNGRTARLLMNLVLIRGGYPPVSVRPADRNAYINALAKADANAGAEDFDRLLYERLDATLGEYVSALNEALPTDHPERDDLPRTMGTRGKTPSPGDDAS